MFRVLFTGVSLKTRPEQVRVTAQSGCAGLRRSFRFAKTPGNVWRSFAKAKLRCNVLKAHCAVTPRYFFVGVPAKTSGDAN
jgi:hypothetical protein